MKRIFNAIKRGNMTSLVAALGNVLIAVLKGIGALLSGSGAMFASTMHSIADTVNQGFVFVGSILSERKPTKKFPSGFGRMINLFCMVAVLVVSFMSYETISEGIHLIEHPVDASNFLLNTLILIAAGATDGFTLIKAMKEIVEESHAEAKGLGIVSSAFKNVRLAAPPTRLVFYEDLISTSGALLALAAVLITHFTSFKVLDGIVTIIIGLLMLIVVFKVGYDNMVGLIGVAAPRAIQEKVSKLIFSDPYVTDINELRVMQEGRFYHVEALMELKPGLTLADADDIKFKMRDTLLNDSDISDVRLGIIEDNGIKDWKPEMLEGLG